MQLLYVYQYDPRKITVQSGRPFMILSQLQKNGWGVDIVVLDGPIFKFCRAVVGALRVFGIYRGDVQRHKLFGNTVRRVLFKYLAKKKYDVIFSPSTIPFRDIRSEEVGGAAMVACCDTLLPGYVKHYGYDGSRIATDMAAESVSISNCTHLIVPTKWAADQLDELDLSRPPVVTVAPFGDNLPNYLDRETVENSIRYSRGKEGRVTFITIMSDWERKNGPLMLRLAEKITNAGISVAIKIIGVGPSDESTIPIGVQVINLGRIDKTDANQAQKMIDELLTSDFFCMPSKGEAFGMAMCEAARCGLPLIGSRNGGIAEIVREFKTGWYLDDAEDLDICASRIIEVWRDRDLYREKALSVLDDHEARLNWAAFYQSSFALLFSNDGSSGVSR